MIKTLMELQNFLLACAPLLTSTAFFALFAILLSKSIKKYATAYYIAFAIPFALVAIPTILRWCGMGSFSFTGVPVLGQILRDYIHMGTLGHPLFIIIMYMGALDMKNPQVKKLMSIRKELSILSGFPILTHTLIRVANSFPNSLKYFTDHDEFIASGRVVSELGAGISSFGLVIGIVLVVLFIPLWITSFNAVHKRMGGAKWKKFQKCAYLFYAIMFVHAMGIQLGGVLNPRGGGQQRTSVEAVVEHTPSQEAIHSAGNSPRVAETQGEPHRETASPDGRLGRGSEQNVQTASGTEGQRSSEQVAPQGNARRHAKGFADIEIGSRTRQYIDIASLLLIYGSYLYLRLRKARNNRRRELQNKTA